MTSSLRKAGVVKGDRVAGVVSNGLEALVAMLATTSLGAIWASCSPDFGPDAIIDRLHQVEPKILFYTTEYQYGGKRFRPVDHLAGVKEKLPSVEQVVLCSPLGDQHPEALGLAFDDYLSDQIEPQYFESMRFDDPVYIMFSSGTTGVPKCVTHGVGGTLLQHKKELAYHTDMTADSRLLYFTTCGWMMWNWMVSALAVDSSIVLFDGSVAQPDLSTLWQVVEEENVTVFGTSPKFISACMQRHIDVASMSLPHVRTILSTGAPLVPEQFAWLYQQIPDIHVASISGGTDIVSCFMLGIPTLPVYAGEIQGPGLGMDVHAYAENELVDVATGEKGELVCTSPFPSMPVCFWNDEGGVKYTKAYFSHFTDSKREIWRHGDYVAMTEHGGIIVYGRSDATLNPGGVRIGTAELYRQVESLSDVEDSLAVGRRSHDDTEIVLFVKLVKGRQLDDDLKSLIRQQIRTHLTPRHLPAEIHAVSDIPYTRSGKKVEMAVTQVIHGESVSNLGALTNPEALQLYKEFSQ
jgi:acetoacetyl-CoA synthetase